MRAAPHSDDFLSLIVAEKSVKKPEGDPRTALYEVAIQLKAADITKSAGINALLAIVKAWGASVSTDEVVKMMRPVSAHHESDAEDPSEPVSKPMVTKPSPVIQATTLPGIGGEIVKWVLARSHRKQPELAVAATLAFGASMLGRRICAPGTPSNLYLLGIGDTGVGKDDARQALKVLMKSVDKLEILAESLASDAGLFAKLKVTPEILLLQDECGHLLRSMSERGAAAHLRGISTALLTLYQNCKTSVIGKLYGDVDNNFVIDQPHLVVYGTTTPSTLWEGITRNQIADGLLPRFLAFKGRPLPSWEDCEPDAAPPASAVRELTAFLCQGGDLQGCSNGPNVRKVWPLSPKAQSDVRAMAADNDAKARSGHPLAALWTRATQKIIAISAVMQLFLNRSADISDEAVQWAHAITVAATDLLIYEAGDTLADNAAESEILKVLAVIRHGGLGGLTLDQVRARTRWVATAARRKEILEGLIEDGSVEKLVYEGHKRGPRPIILTARV